MDRRGFVKGVVGAIGILTANNLKLEVSENQFEKVPDEFIHRDFLYSVSLALDMGYISNKTAKEITHNFINNKQHG